jgi:hypothetical protein
MEVNVNTTHACPFCGSVTARILDKYELNAITASQDASGDVTAYQCMNAHVFFVSMAWRGPVPDNVRTMKRAAGASS